MVPNRTPQVFEARTCADLGEFDRTPLRFAAPSHRDAQSVASHACWPTLKRRMLNVASVRTMRDDIGLDGSLCGLPTGRARAVLVDAARDEADLSEIGRHTLNDIPIPWWQGRTLRFGVPPR